MRRRIWIVCLGLVILGNTRFFAREAGDWFEGVVIMNDHEILTGEVKVSGVVDVVQLKTFGTIRCIQASDINQISFYDPSINCIRTIIPAASDKASRCIGFFEIIIRGEVSLLASYHEFNQFDPSFTAFNGQTISLPDDIELYFYDGKIMISSRYFRKQVFPAFMKIFEDDLSRFIRSQRIRIDDPADQIRLLKRFNQLYSDTELLAKE
jgi:hypothetical protein